MIATAERKQPRGRRRRVRAGRLSGQALHAGATCHASRPRPKKKKALRHVFDHLEVCAHEDAIHACDRAIQATPRYALDALRIKAESLVALGRAEEATAIYQSIARPRPYPGRAWATR